ncbi:hypothetical protein R3P38DRAFT_3239505 [Favolaschia claudopus]|uniref:Uncharacterized protein n=1 Tax=Favolaschia claudopus TaxID=2862362 RepID=A0AAV9Z8R8_9AGAR
MCPHLRSADNFFGNPPRTIAPCGECCDLCSGRGPFPAQSDQPLLPSTPPAVSSNSTPASTPNKHGKRPRITRDGGADQAGPKFRTGAHLASCKSAIERWSFRVIKRDYTDGPFTADMLVGSTLITYLAHNRFRSLDELRTALGKSTRSWALVEMYGQEVLDLLVRLDGELKAERQHAVQEKENERRRREEERAMVLEQRRIELEAPGVWARRQLRENARAAKQQKAIDEFIAKLNGPRKAGKPHRPSDGFLEYITNNPHLLTPSGTDRWATYPPHVPLATTDLNQPPLFLGNISLS